MNQLKIIKEHFDKKGIDNKVVKLPNGETQLNFVYEYDSIPWHIKIREIEGSHGVVSIYKVVYHIHREAKREVCKILNRLNGWGGKYLYVSFSCHDVEDATLVVGSYSLPVLKKSYLESFDLALDCFMADIVDAAQNDLIELTIFET